MTTFMNEYEIAAAHRRLDGPAQEAARQIAIVAEWANANSDGWCYWPKPLRACQKLIILVNDALAQQYAFDPAAGPTSADLRAALRPLKAFRTRQGADFQVIAA